MRRLFTEDNYGSLDVLAIICEHLSSAKDLLALGQVSELTRIAVTAHQLHNEVTFCWCGEECIREGDPIDGEQIDCTDLDRCGPIIRWLCVQIQLESGMMAAFAIKWFEIDFHHGRW